MRRLLTWFLLLLCFATPALAQTSTTAVPTAFTFLLLPASGDPLTVAPISQFTTSIGPTQNCGIDPSTLPAPATGTPINPLLFMVNDPFTEGRKCRLGFPTGLAPGNYQWAGVFVSPSCVPETGGPQFTCSSPTRGVGQPPFSVVNPVTPPPVPTGLAALTR